MTRSGRQAPPIAARRSRSSPPHGERRQALPVEGIEIGDPKRYGDESDPRICGHEMTAGAEDGGRTAMETLLQKCPDISVVYTINEPAAAGAWEALKAAGKDDGSVLVVSIDGGSPGVKNVEAGIIGATSQQYPHKMASMALEAITAFEGWHQARENPRSRVLRHRRHADHRQAGRRRAFDQRRGRPEALLGLISFGVEIRLN